VGEGGRVGGENLRDVLASRKRRSRAHSLANVCSFCYQYELAASAVYFVGIHTGVERIGTPAERHYVALTLNALETRWTAMAGWATAYPRLHVFTRCEEKGKKEKEQRERERERGGERCTLALHDATSVACADSCVAAVVACSFLTSYSCSVSKNYLHPCISGVPNAGCYKSTLLYFYA